MNCVTNEDIIPIPIVVLAQLPNFFPVDILDPIDFPSVYSGLYPKKNILCRLSGKIW